MLIKNPELEQYLYLNAGFTQRQLSSLIFNVVSVFSRIKYCDSSILTFQAPEIENSPGGEWSVPHWLFLNSNSLKTMYSPDSCAKPLNGWQPSLPSTNRYSPSIGQAGNYWRHNTNNIRHVIMFHLIEACVNVFQITLLSRLRPETWTGLVKQTLSQLYQSFTEWIYMLTGQQCPDNFIASTFLMIGQTPWNQIENPVKSPRSFQICGARRNWI